LACYPREYNCIKQHWPLQYQPCPLIVAQYLSKKGIRRWCV